MKKCKKCCQDIESNHIRTEREGFWNPIGYYCPDCDIIYGLDLESYEKALINDLQPINRVSVRIKGEWKRIEGYYCSGFNGYYDPKSGVARLRIKVHKL